MNDERIGQVAVIFVSHRRGGENGDADEVGYAAAASNMAELAARQPGYRGIDSVRDERGDGITVSYWANDEAALAWRDHPDHRRTRDQGRRDWYDRYTVIVARVERGYRWSLA